MLTSMVAGPGPAYYNNENGGRHPQVLEAVSPQLTPPPPPPQSSSHGTPIALNSPNSITTTPASSPNANGNMVAVTPVEVCHGGQQEYTPPPMPALAQTQGPPPPYYSPEYYPGEPYYTGPPPEYNCHSHHPTCALNSVPALNGVSGPATVRMVSTNATPPIPLPVQMPPGHVVQQIVDENGTLQHVIVSAQPVLPVCPYGPNANQGHHQFYNHAPPGPPQAYMTTYPTAPPYSPVISPPLTQHSPPPPPHTYSKCERNPRQFDKARNKYYPRQQHTPSQHHYSSQNQHPKSSSSTSIHSTPPLSPKKEIQVRKLGEEENVNGDSGQGPQQYVLNTLSQIKTPEVSDITPYGANLQWKPPDFSNCSVEGFSSNDVGYNVFLNNSFHTSLNNTQLTLSNLRPGTEYKIYLVCTCNSLKGNRTPVKTFCTKATQPDPPQPPRCVERTKNSLVFRWASAKDNGARISNYILEVKGGHLNTWTEINCHRNKQGTILKLKPQTNYRIRLAAVNEIGSSEYCSEVTESTSGLAPSQPLPPTLQKATVDTLTLAWIARPYDETFTLQIEDTADGYGFINASIGREHTFTCTSLRRNSVYKFRVCSHNREGSSPYSGIASYRTLPDRPCRPSAPTLKGKGHSEKLSVSWNPPKDQGGTAVTNYHVEVDKGKGFEKVYSGSQSECELRGLVPGKSYQVRVQGESSGGLSDWSDEGTVTTKPVAPGICNPPRLQGKPKAHTLQLKWAYPEFDGGAVISEFQVEMVLSVSERKQVYCGRDLECTVASLLPGRPYTFLLRAVNRVGPGCWSEGFETLSGACEPEATKSPRLSCKDPHTAFLSWDEPVNNGASIEEYIVHVAECSSDSSDDFRCSDTAFTHAYTGSSTSCEVRSLCPATSYAFRVCALNSAGQSAWSPVSRVTTPPAPPAPVADICSDADATEVTIGWAEPASHGDAILCYIIDIADRTITTSGPIYEYTVMDLMPETTYKIRIKAVNSVGAGAFGPAHKMITGALPPPPPRLDLLKASYNSLRLKWGDGRNPDLLKYSLQMELLNPHKTMEFYQVYIGTNQSFKVGKLEENTTYKFRICATNEAGIGPYSPVVELTTTKAPPLPLKSPKVAEGPDGTYCLEWSSIRCPGDDKILYKLQMLQAGKDQDYSLVYQGNEASHVLTGLEPQTGYYVRVCGVRMCTDGEVMSGAYSSPALFNTPKAPEQEVDKTAEKVVQERALNWQTLSDHEKALVLLAVFSLLAFISAYVLSPDASLR